jgi:hypothetical protein
MAIGPRSAIVDQCSNAPVSSAIDHSLSLLSSLDPKSSSTKKLLRSERAAMTSCRLHITAATQDSRMPRNCYNEYKRIPARESYQCAAAFRPLMPLMSKFMSSFLLPRRSRVLSTWPSRAPLIPRLAAHCPRSRVAVCATSASDRTARTPFSLAAPPRPAQHKGSPPRYIVHVRPAPVMRILQKKKIRRPSPHPPASANAATTFLTPNYTNNNNLKQAQVPQRLAPSFERARWQLWR